MTSTITKRSQKRYQRLRWRGQFWCTSTKYSPWRSSFSVRNTRRSFAKELQNSPKRTTSTKSKESLTLRRDSGRLLWQPNPSAEESTSSLSRKKWRTKADCMWSKHSSRRSSRSRFRSKEGQQGKEKAEVLNWSWIKPNCRTWDWTPWNLAGCVLKMLFER